MDINKTDIPVSDKQALINMAIHIIEKLRKNGKAEEEIKNILKSYGFSDILIEQIMY